MADVQLVDFGDGFSAYTAAELEARFIHNEIFTENCYDITQFSEEPLLVDVGANIGMFSMYMKRKYPKARILAFEPAPITYGILERNLEHHGLSGAGIEKPVEAHRCALGAEQSTGTLTFYPMVPGNSTFVPEEKDVMKTLIPIENKERKQLVDKAFSTFEKVDVPIKRLSDFFKDDADAAGRDIDLLKIDVEARELQVCQGLDDEHWQKVRNVVIEVFDLHGNLEVMDDLLKSKGFVTERQLAIKDQEGQGSDKPKVYNLLGRRATS